MGKRGFRSSTFFSRCIKKLWAKGDLLQLISFQGALNKFANCGQKRIYFNYFLFNVHWKICWLLAKVDLLQLALNSVLVPEMLLAYNIICQLLHTSTNISGFKCVEIWSSWHCSHLNVSQAFAEIRHFCKCLGNSSNAICSFVRDQHVWFFLLEKVSNLGWADAICSFVRDQHVWFPP